MFGSDNFIAVSVCEGKITQDESEELQNRFI